MTSEHDPKVIEALLKRCRPNHMAADLSRELDKLAELRKRVARVWQDRCAARVHLREVEASCDRELIEIRKCCPHAFGTNSEGPPENKSWCTLCGEEM